MPENPQEPPQPPYYEAAVTKVDFQLHDAGIANDIDNLVRIYDVPESQRGTLAEVLYAIARKSFVAGQNVQLAKHIESMESKLQPPDS